MTDHRPEVREDVEWLKQGHDYLLLMRLLVEDQVKQGRPGKHLLTAVQSWLDRKPSAPPIEPVGMREKHDDEKV